MSFLKKAPKSILLLWVILFCGCYYLFNDTMKVYPSYLHAWTQTDRLAIAQNFQHNGFDFFHPATYNLYTKNGITQVDFPLHDYLVALISDTFELELVPVFRWYNLIWSLLGFSFLYLCFLRVKASTIRGVFFTVFVATLPFYVYYQNGFLPSSTAISSLFIGLFFLIRGLQKPSTANFIFSAFFVGLSALTRSTFVFQLMAFGLVVMFSFFRNKKQLLKAFLPFLIMALAFIAYTFYNRTLANDYGSMFLQEFLNIRSLDELAKVIEGALNRWSKQIMTPYHGIVLFAILIAAALQFKKAKPTTTLKAMGLLFLISLGTSMVFFILMGRQFVDHDYYYLSIIVPTLSYALIATNQYITIPKKLYTPILTVCGIFLFYFYSQSKQVQNQRYTPKWNDRIEYAYQVYERAKDDIEKWGIEDRDTLTILEANSTNIPFTIWHKRGYTSLNSKAELVDSILKYPKQYVVMIDSFFRLDAYRDYPQLIDRLNLEHTNGEISFYTDNPTDRSAKEFFEHYIFACHMDFESPLATHQKFTGTNRSALENEWVHLINPTSEFSLTYEDTLTPLLQDRSVRISLVADFWTADTSNTIQLVCQAGDYYFTHYLENSLQFSEEWETKQFDFKISADRLQAKSPIKIYFWNPDGKALYLDNYHLIIYQ